MILPVRGACSRCKQAPSDDLCKTSAVEGLIIRPQG